MTEIKMNKWKYIVWVGGVDDYYTDYKRAKEHYDKWIEQGYDDVILEKIKNDQAIIKRSRACNAIFFDNYFGGVIIPVSVESHSLRYI